MTFDFRPPRPPPRKKSEAPPATEPAPAPKPSTLDFRMPRAVRQAPPPKVIAHEVRHVDADFERELDNLEREDRWQRYKRGEIGKHEAKTGQPAPPARARCEICRRQMSVLLTDPDREHICSQCIEEERERRFKEQQREAAFGRHFGNYNPSPRKWGWDDMDDDIPF